MTTIGQILVNETLPQKYRDYNRTLGADEIEDILATIARDDSALYSDVSGKLMRLGTEAAYESGATLRLSDIRPIIDKSKHLAFLDAQEAKIRSAKNLTPKQREELIDDLYNSVNSVIEKETYATGVSKANPFAMQVKSKARGTPGQFASIVSTPGIYKDSNGKTVQTFIRNSYAEGLTPAELWAGSYGARTGVVSTKFATAKGGAFGKKVSSVCIDQVVTEDDCGAPYGFPVKASDKDNIGCVLQQDAGGYTAGTVITKSVFADLQKKNLDEILVRSPVTCSCKDGICSKCAGIRETGKFPEIGYNIGLNAGSALGERIAQGSLNCLAEGTLVRMADGSTKPIEKVEPGELVLGSDLNGNISPTKVVARYDNGIQPCVSTRFIENGTHRSNNTGIVLESTVIHQILGTRVVTGQLEEKLNWVPRMLEVGRKSREFYAYSVSSFDDSGLMEEPLAMLLGALLGDGCYTESVSGVHLSCADDTEVDDLNRTLQGYDLRLRRLKYHNGIYYRVSQSSSSSGKNVIKNYLREHGMYGKLAHDKEIPPVVHTWNNHSVGCFIGGLVATDGSVYSSDNNGKPAVSFSSTSKKLVLQFKELIGLRFGILGSAVTKTNHAGTEHRKHDQWQFTITKPEEVVRFHNNVTIPGVKQHRLSKMLAEYTPGSVKQCKVAFKRVEQKDIGLRHVYDLEVECKDHIYLLANGLIVHNTKHTGRKIEGASRFSGFEMLKAMADVPKQYPDKAILSDIDGKVTKIVAAPQGGNYIYVNDQRHYVPQGYDLMVKEGDELEAGDQMSDGVINTAEIVKYKGIGEGRRYFTNRFTQAFKDSGYKANRRNIEVLARSLVDHVEINDPEAEGQFLPGDVATYSQWSFGYKPRPTAVRDQPGKLLGSYLEEPVLHYTVGSRVTKKMVDDLKKFKIDKILADKQPIEVTPIMKSITEGPAYKGDWVGRLGTTYIKQRLVEDAQHGAKSNIHGVHPLPGIAKGVEFGNYGEPGVNRPGGFTY